jgi:hypothetical protein
MSAAEKGDSLHQHHGQPARTRPLRLVTENDAHAGATTAATPARARPALAVWPLACRGTRPLPRELARQLLAHYSEPGELVIAAASAREALRAAQQLGRRSLLLTTCARTLSVAPAVTQLHADERADLAIAALGAVASARAASRAARLNEWLKPGAFVVLALDGSHGPLGAIVRACQRQGLQYWQHIIALDPRQLAREAKGGGTRGDAVRSIRCHRDLLVFRRPAEADALASEAANAAVAA